MPPDAMDLDSPPPPPAPDFEPYNPCRHLLPFARDTNEPIAHFLQRLPPAQASLMAPARLLPPWYWIANLHRSAYPTHPQDVPSFKREGTALLQAFRQNLANRGGWGDLAMKEQLREALNREIGEAAKRWGVTAGKWMLFPQVNEVNEVWRTVCEGVDANRLGTGAKVSTSGKEEDPARLICVYTRDFTDVEDVRRVLSALVEMGLVRADMPRGIMYKCDAYTYLDIYGNNEYGLRASNYSSKEMLGGS